MRKRDISQRDFAASIGEHSQTLNAVITGRRNLTTEMAIKFEQLLGYEEGFLLTLQVFHPIAEYKNRLAAGSVNGVPIVRRVLFWDADFDTVDWGAMFFGTWRRGGQSRNSPRFYNMPVSELCKYEPNNSFRIKRQDGNR